MGGINAETAPKKSESRQINLIIMRTNFKRKLVVLSLVICILSLNFIPLNANNSNEYIGIGEEVAFVGHNGTDETLMNKRPLPLIGLVLLAGALHYSATWAAHTQQGSKIDRDDKKVGDGYFAFSERHQNSELHKQIAFNNLD